MNKMLADWLSQRPAEALSKFILWILKEVLDDAHAHAASHKSSKTSAPSSQRTKVEHSLHYISMDRCVIELNLFSVGPFRSFHVIFLVW